MTLITTLPAGTYRVTGTTSASSLSCEERKATRGGRARADERVVWLNHNDTCNRSAAPSYLRIRETETGPATFLGKPGALVVLDGAEILRPLATHIGFDVGTTRGTLACTKTMAVMPVDREDVHHFNNGVAYWHDVTSDQPIEVRYEDLVLTVGDLVIDQRASFALTHSGVTIRPGDPVFSLLAPNCIDPRPSAVINAEVAARLDKLGAPGVRLADYWRNFSDRFPEVTLHFGPASDGGHPAETDIHMASGMADGVVRRGSALHDLLKPRFQAPDRIVVDDIGADMVKRVKAIGGSEADMVLAVFNLSRKRGYADACFTPYVDHA